MAKKISAGLLLYRRQRELEVFLAHPGGPFFAKKDDGFWGIPKGEIEYNEPYLDAAVREFFEETGIQPAGEYIPLGSVTLSTGKIVHAWAFEGDWDSSMPLHSNKFCMEWPPNSGKQQWFPEIDKAAFFTVGAAIKKINSAQAAFINRLEHYLHLDRSTLG
jgi:predicted NUDIX family NTP pyrophosphohydrolase